MEATKLGDDSPASYPPFLTPSNTAEAVYMLDCMFEIAGILSGHIKKVWEEASCLQNILFPLMSWSFISSLFSRGYRISGAAMHGVMDRWVYYAGSNKEGTGLYGGRKGRTKGCCCC